VQTLDHVAGPAKLSVEASRHLSATLKQRLPSSLRACGRVVSAAQSDGAGRVGVGAQVVGVVGGAHAYENVEAVRPMSLKVLAVGVANLREVRAGCFPLQRLDHVAGPGTFSV